MTHPLTTTPKGKTTSWNTSQCTSPREAHCSLMVAAELRPRHKLQVLCLSAGLSTAWPSCLLGAHVSPRQVRPENTLLPPAPEWRS